MITVVTGSVYPPDNSGDWYDDGWGGWTKETSIIGKIPLGYFDDGWGNLEPSKPNPTLDIATVNNVKKAKKDAKTFEDTAVGKTMNDILKYGNSFIDLLVRAKIISNANAPISYDNINQEELEKARRNGTISQSSNVNLPTNNTPNSAFLGIDFNKPQNIFFLVILGVFFTLLFNKLK